MQSPYFFVYFLWQVSDIGQDEQPHPQEDLPFFLSFISFTKIVQIATKSITAMIIVERFCKSQPNNGMEHASFIFVLFFLTKKAEVLTALCMGGKAYI